MGENVQDNVIAIVKSVTTLMDVSVIVKMAGKVATVVKLSIKCNDQYALI